MTTYHIHINGVVQGVGFRPTVLRLAKKMDVKGWVNNTTDGVHILASADEAVLRKFYTHLLQEPPVNAQITSHKAELIAPQWFDDFYIQHSEANKRSAAFVTPDLGLCADCRNELFDERNRRHRYPFLTCTQCGPRYSIITELPYDRPGTTMEPYDQCWQCSREYHDPANRRYYSQTNSCAACGIPLALHDSKGTLIDDSYESILVKVDKALRNGQIVAVKGVGGYLLLCDAANSVAITALRQRKHRPAKPLAVLYPDIETVEKDVVLQPCEKVMLQSVTAPIVLGTMKSKGQTGICLAAIAPGLNKVGVMLPYSPLLALIAAGFQQPLVATSGNLSGSPIFYKDEDALTGLAGVADLFLTYEREIVVPQDDSVLQYTKRHRQKIILRRSRGLAPNFFSPPFAGSCGSVLAMGAEMKSSFALLQDDRCYVSQYLGDQESLAAQQSFSHTLKHLTGLLRFEPDAITTDKHPGYFTAQAGRELAAQYSVPVLGVQHHKAHFCAVLAENQLLHTDDPVLGVIWDGAGYGDDGQVWGGEFFLFRQGQMERLAHLDYFPVFAGNKMAREPRLSALSLLGAEEEYLVVHRKKFNEREWTFYGRAARSSSHLQTSSMGRLLDGVASLLDVCDVSTYEGEAAMRLEALATTAASKPEKVYSFPVNNGIVCWKEMISGIIQDLSNGAEKNMVALKVHCSLAALVAQIARRAGVRKIAFSGGVMQNALLTDLLIDKLKRFDLFFHQQLSPNDECISFGQLAYWQLQVENNWPVQKKKVETLV